MKRSELPDHPISLEYDSMSTVPAQATILVRISLLRNPVYINLLRAAESDFDFSGMFSSKINRIVPIIFRCTKDSSYSIRRNVVGDFKSAYSVDKIYPKSNVDFTTAAKPPDSSNEFSGYIPMDKLEVMYSKSSGPGGQNVNKVNTKVEIRFHLETAEWIPKETRSLLLEKYRTKLTKEGLMSIKSEKTRFQMLNLADCLDKLRFLIRNGAKPLLSETLETVEQKKQNIEWASRERLREKRQRASVKEGRRDPILEE